MHRWKLFDFVSPAGRNLILKWYSSDLTCGEQARLDSLMAILRKKHVWGYPEFKMLSGQQKGLGEIRLSGDRRAIRLVGFHRPGVAEFILLIGCTKKGRSYEPPNALETAVIRKRQVDEGTGRVCEHGHETP
jgi:hypothetical protein